MVETEEQNKVGIALSMIFLFFVAAAAYYAIITPSNTRPDSDCIEWGVEVIDINKGRDWAKIPYTPKDRETAEQIAKQLEEQDRSGRYYEAKCKKYKGD